MGGLTHQAHGHLSIKEADLPRWLASHHLHGVKHMTTENKMEKDADGVVRSHEHVIMVMDPASEKVEALTKEAHDEDVASGALLQNLVVFTGKLTNEP